ncbi:MAG: hypothetical protein JSS20_17515 [Proteobacteria bacterium]|nr:hypothetical protein [Pseudomonadota bacterium]
MPNEIETPRADASERELALWMLEKMRNSVEFLGVLKGARIKGQRDILDEPDYIQRQQQRLKRLHQADSEDVLPVSSSVAARIDALVKRDLLSSREEFIEKAIGAYLDRHPRGREELPAEWQSTIEAARAEIEGRTSGNFEPGFTAELAAAAREELARQLEASLARSLAAERGGRET